MITDRIKQLRERERWGLLIAGCVILALIIDNVIVHRLTARSAGLQAEIETAQRELKYMRRLLAEEKTVALQYEDANQLIGSVQSEDAGEELKIEVENMAKQAGLVLVSSGDRKAQLAGRWGTYYVDISKFESDMGSLLRFLEEVRRSPGLLSVERLVLSPEKAQGQVKGTILLSKLMTIPLAAEREEN